MVKELYNLEKYLRRMLKKAENNNDKDMIEIINTALIGIEKVWDKHKCEAMDLLNGIL